MYACEHVCMCMCVCWIEGEEGREKRGGRCCCCTTYRIHDKEEPVPLTSHHLAHSHTHSLHNSDKGPLTYTCTHSHNHATYIHTIPKHAIPRFIKEPYFLLHNRCKQLKTGKRRHNMHHTSTLSSGTYMYVYVNKTCVTAHA